MSTKRKDYTDRLLEQETWWKRVLDVQMPYRLHLRRLKLGRVLDVGCGVGRNLINIRGDAEAIGIDHNPHSVEIARSRGLSAFTPDEFFASSHARPSHYDSLLLSHVAEHMRLEEAIALLEVYLPCLRPGGRVIIITPQEAGYRSDETHVEFIDFEKISAIMEATGLKLLHHYSFPLPRPFGRVFKHNEFVAIGEKSRQP
ncbi:MAG TPA: class I SAM-dependent methyltransferase [Blastocatellia bacterium]|nr:class I SAM-dependent methyltransferase [Blastocatellia bacterium]